MYMSIWKRQCSASVWPSFEAWAADPAGNSGVSTTLGAVFQTAQEERGGGRSPSSIIIIIIGN